MKNNINMTILTNFVNIKFFIIWNYLLSNTNYIFNVSYNNIEFNNNQEL